MLWCCEFAWREFQKVRNQSKLELSLLLEKSNGKHGPVELTVRILVGREATLRNYCGLRLYTLFNFCQINSHRVDAAAFRASQFTHRVVYPYPDFGVILTVSRGGLSEEVFEPLHEKISRCAQKISRLEMVFTTYKCTHTRSWSKLE